jgi:hypothetical protein
VNERTLEAGLGRTRERWFIQIYFSLFKTDVHGQSLANNECNDGKKENEREGTRMGLDGDFVVFGVE